MKKNTHNRRVITAAIAVLVSSTCAANATVEHNNGTNNIAFSQQRGDKTANIVLSTLDLAMMDPVERDNMLASLETQFGKPKVWASRAGRTTSKSLFAFGRDGQKEKYGVRLRARQAVPLFNSLLSQVAPADKVPSVLGEMASADLLGVERSEALTRFSIFQDDYLGSQAQAVGFKFNYDIKAFNEGFNFKVNWGEGFFSPPWNGFSFKVKFQMDVAGRLEYNQWWYKPQMSRRGGWSDIGDETRNIVGAGSIGVRPNVQLICSWGYDFPLPWAGYWGLGAEASIAIGGWPAVDARMVSTNTSNIPDENNVTLTFRGYIEGQGLVWIGNTEQKDPIGSEITNPESHKLNYGAKAGIQYTGNGGLTGGWKFREYDWYNDRHNNTMDNNLQIFGVETSGKIYAREEFKFGNVTFQNGYLIWEGSTRAYPYTSMIDRSYNRDLDRLL